MKVKKDGRLHRLLTIELARTTDRARAARSFWVWGEPHPGHDIFVLRPVGIIRALTGGRFSIRWDDE